MQQSSTITWEVDDYYEYIPYKPLWLNRGGMAEKWWACLDLNQGLLVPNQQA